MTQLQCIVLYLFSLKTLHSSPNGLSCALLSRHVFSKSMISLGLPTCPFLSLSRTIQSHHTSSHFHLDNVHTLQCSQFMCHFLRDALPEIHHCGQDAPPLCFSSPVLPHFHCAILWWNLYLVIFQPGMRNPQEGRSCNIPLPIQRWPTMNMTQQFDHPCNFSSFLR